MHFSPYLYTRQSFHWLDDCHYWQILFSYAAALYAIFRFLFHIADVIAGIVDISHAVIGYY